MKKRLNKNGIFYVVISLVAVLGIGTGLYAYSNSNSVNVNEGGVYNYNEAEQPVGQLSEDFNLGAAPGTDFTVNNLTYGSDLSATLRFVAGATTTPGGLFRILNTSSRKICDLVEVDITSASDDGGFAGAGGPIDIYVSTSSAATAFSATGVGLIPTTTVSTSTTPLISNVSSPGSFYGGIGLALSTTTKPWVWEKGTYLLGAFTTTVQTGGVATSSDVYTNMQGKMYVRCHSADK